MIRGPEKGRNSSGRSVENITGHPTADGLLADMLLTDDQTERETLARQVATSIGYAAAAGRPIVSLTAINVAAIRSRVPFRGAFADELFHASSKAMRKAQTERSSQAIERVKARIDFCKKHNPGNIGAIEHCLEYGIEDDLGRFSDADYEAAIPSLVTYAGIEGEKAERLIRHLSMLGRIGRDGREAEARRDYQAEWNDRATRRLERKQTGLSCFATYAINPETGRAVADEEFEAAEIAHAKAEAAEAAVGSGAGNIAIAVEKGAGLGSILVEAFVAACRIRDLPVDIESMIASFVEASGDTDLAGIFERTIAAARDCAGPADTEAAFSRLLAAEGVAPPFTFAPEAPAALSDAVAQVEAPVAQAEGPAAPAASADDDAPPANASKSTAAQREAEMESLTHVPGAVGDLVDWIVGTSMNPNRTIAFAGALAAIGTLGGRLYETETSLRTNIYTIAIAPSAFGKDHARSVINILFEEAKCADRLGGSKLASGTGLRRRVEDNPSVLYMVDEFGGTVRKMNDVRNSHHAEIKDLLLEFYESASDVFRGTDYAGQKGKPIYNPNLSVYGMSNPDSFWNACQAVATVDGYLARNLIFAVGAREPVEARPRLKKSAPPTALVDALRDLTRPKVGGNLNCVTADGSTSTRALAVPFGKGAEDAFYEAKTRWKKAGYAKRGRPEESIYGRVVENGLKIALIIAIGVDPDLPVITVERFEHGLKVAAHCAETALREIRGRLADNDRQREHVDVLRIISEAGWAGIDNVKLRTTIHGRFNERRLMEILQSLENGSKQIVSTLRPTKGRPKMCFVAVENLGLDEKEG